MEKIFKCAECGTKYSTTSNIPPPSPNWADGHVCIMIEFHEDVSSFKFRQPGKQIGSTLAHSHKLEYRTGEYLTDKEAREKAFGYANKSAPLQNGSPIMFYDEDAGEERMKVIGQNGNTGEHYGKEEFDG